MKITFDFNLDYSDLHRICVQKRWFTRGTVVQYEEMFSLVDNTIDGEETPTSKETLRKVAEMIYDFSDICSVVQEDIEDTKEQYLDTLTQEDKLKIIQGIINTIIREVSRSKFYDYIIEDFVFVVGE